MEMRRKHPRWGAKKLLKVLQRRQSKWELPARSTCCDLLKRHGLVDASTSSNAPWSCGPPDECSE